MRSNVKHLRFALFSPEAKPSVMTIFLAGVEDAALPRVIMVDAICCGQYGSRYTKKIAKKWKKAERKKRKNG